MVTNGFSVYRIFAIVFLGFLLSFLGCSESDDGDSTIELTTYNFSGSVAGSVSGLQLLVQNQDTEKVYVADVESDGSFSVDVGIHEENEAGNVFFVSMVSGNRYVGAVVADYDSADTEVSTGVAIVGSEADLNIAYDATKGVGVLSDSDNTVTLNTVFKTRLNSEKPVGIESVGKGTSSQTSSLELANKLDKDQDGVPNIFDAMDNGQDLDNTDIDTSTAAIAGSSVVSQARMFMNYKIEKDDADASVTRDALITIEVKASDASRITSIVADSVHAHYENSVTAQFPDGFEDLDGYEAEVSWKDDTGYRLYHAKNMEDEHIWTVFIKPQNNDFVPGDLIRLKATLTDGTSEYYWVTIHFKFQETVRDTLSGLSGDGTLDSPYCLANSGDQTFTWNKPIDSDGAELEELAYALELFYLERKDLTSSVHKDTAHFESVGEDILTHTLTEAVIDRYASESPAATILKVDIKGSYEYGDNAALMVFVARQSWGTCE